MSFTDAIRHAAIAHHTKDQLRSILTHKRQPTLLGFTKHVLEYKQVHTVVAKPQDFYLEDIERDLAALYDPELPPYIPETYVSEYARHLQTLPYHLQGTHWYVLSCAHASGGSVVADSIRFSSYFLRKRDVTPIKDAFTDWTDEWCEKERKECVSEIPEVFRWASGVNDMIYF
jgi:hypothetical protein